MLSLSKAFPVIAIAKNIVKTITKIQIDLSFFNYPALAALSMKNKIIRNNITGKNASTIATNGYATRDAWPIAMKDCINGSAMKKVNNISIPIRTAMKTI
jgi:hypothetical protein